MLYVFEHGYDVVKVTKNICCANDEDTVDHITVNRWSKKFCSGRKNLDDQAKTGASKTELQAITANAKRTLGEYQISVISRSSM